MVINTIFSEYFSAFLIYKPSHTKSDGQCHLNDAHPIYSFVTINNFFGLSCHLKKFGHGFFLNPVYECIYYVCMYVCVCVCMFICMCRYVCMYPWLCVCMYV